MHLCVRPCYDAHAQAMRYARALIPTLEEAPADATSVSHVLLVRAGYARRVGAGIYSYLPLLRLKDRKGITDLARRELESYRDPPKNLLQIQTKFSASLASKAA